MAVGILQWKCCMQYRGMDGWMDGRMEACLAGTTKEKFPLQKCDRIADRQMMTMTTKLEKEKEQIRAHFSATTIIESNATFAIRKKRTPRNEARHFLYVSLCITRHATAAGRSMG